ncbi:TetR/AcrR family transcriptional regulator [Marisediminicola sp. LYQ134]|uniref:TetR/AcrR family transcriptional regulator n=1 Tax=unclassified Marisediminicola TaxID=2618316 RepID=UPI003982F8CF
MSSATDLREIALAEFATAGYAGTSIHRIAELAGLSKSAVLYHYSSKEALLEAAISPAITTMEAHIARFSSRPFGPETRQEFLEGFVDFLLEHRREVNLFINQGPSLVDVPVVDRATEVIRRLADFFESASPALEDRMRFAVALGGAAYMLCAEQYLEREAQPIDETRVALVTIITELLAPVGANSTT